MSSRNDETSSHMNKIIKPIGHLRGEISLPGDKSISHRVVFIGAISKGKTTGRNFLNAEDTLRTVSAFRDMGIAIEIKGKDIGITGGGLRGLKKPAGELYLGNSGTTARITPGILAGQGFKATLTGDESLSKRPMNRIIGPLSKMGVDIKSKKIDLLPLVITGGEVVPLEYSTKVASAQVKSCILFAALYANGTTCLTEPFTSRDHTERMLEFCGAKVRRAALTIFLEGGHELAGKDFFIPGDISSAAFFIAGASILEGSDIIIREVGLNPTRIGFLSALSRMGADISILNKKETVEPYGDVRVRQMPLKPLHVKAGDVPLLIDEVPILAVLASCIEGKTVIEGISELKVKETDRIASMTENLKRMGVDIKSVGESLVVIGQKRRLTKAVLSSFGDHRTAMSLAIAALSADGDSVIENTDCVNTSFPEFFRMLEYLKK